MHYKIKIFILLTLFATRVSAQNEISGKITDRNKEPLAGVTIALLNYRDSLYISGTSSNSEGIFSIKNVSAGNYLLSFSMIGYRKQIIEIQINNNLSKRISDVVLEEDIYLLSTVTVEGKQSPVRFEEGKIIIHLASTILGSQGTLFDALKNLPEVFIKEDGSITLNGQSGVNVLINGKMTPLSGENLANLLKSMPASSVDNIELITNPSAQYDASGKAGLINIKLMKSLFGGTSGAFNANYQQGKRGKGYIGGRFAFQNEKLALSTTYYRYQGRKKNTVDIVREYPLENDEFFLMVQHNKTEYQDANNYFRIGMDYDITKNITANCYFYGTLNNRITPQDNWTDFSVSPAFIPDSTLYTLSKTDNNQKTYAGGIFSEYKDDSKKEMNISADFFFHNNQTSMDMNSRMEELPNNLAEYDSMTGFLPSKINLFATQGNFSTPTWKHSILKAGFKSSWVQIENTTDYRTKQDDNWQPDLSSNNQNKYSENINALYLQWEAKINKWSLNTGLRMENTRISGSHFPDDPVQRDSSYNQNYTNLFPNIMLQYDFLDDKNILSLIYNKRITRPNYRDLLPFNQIWDKYTIATGNPNLKAELRNQLSLTHIYRRNYQTSFIMFSTKEAIAQNYRVEENNTVYVFPDNISSMFGCGFQFYAQNFIRSKRWQQGINIAAFRMNSRWIESGDRKTSSAYSFNFNTNHQFLFGAGWSAEIHGSYNAKTVVAQTTILPFGVVNIGIRKNILKDNASIQLYAEDIFLTNYESLLIDIKAVRSRATTINDSKNIGIAFSYNFKHGKQKRKISQERNIDESKRVNL